MTISDKFTPPKGHWHFEYITSDLIQVERVEKIVFHGKTAYQDILIQDAYCFGRSLVLDGKTQSTELDEFVYHEALVQPSMLTHPDPQTVFVAGGGEGATIRQVLSHSSVNRVVMVDIDREVVELCRKFLPNHHQGAFDDPRLSLYHTDALRYLEETSEQFDIIIIDVPDPLEQGPAFPLFTREFYDLVKTQLTPEGLLVAQSGPTGPAFYQQCFSAVTNTVSSVFPKVFISEVFVPSYGTTWGFVIGSLGPSPTNLSAERVDQLIAERISNELRFYDGITHQGMFSVPKYLRTAVASEDRIITQTNPLFVS